MQIVFHGILFVLALAQFCERARPLLDVMDLCWRETQAAIIE